MAPVTPLDYVPALLQVPIALRKKTDHHTRFYPVTLKGNVLTYIILLICFHSAIFVFYVISTLDHQNI